MNKRLYLLRKSLKISQEDFGKQLGVTGASISRLEKGDRNITEQMIKSICREFNVDYIWLTTGEGEMFLDNDSAFMDKIDQIMFGEKTFHKNLLKMAINLTDEELEVIEGLLDKYQEIKKKADD